MSWFKLARKANKYAETAAETKFNEKADPRVQLEQALQEANEQHDRLVGAAASVIANQKQAEMRLHRALDDLDEAQADAKTAITMAESATDPAKKATYTSAAQGYASKIVSLKATVEHLKALTTQATEAATQAQDAVRENSEQLQERLAQRQELLSALDQTKMQEDINATMNTLQSSASTIVPTLDQVRDKIEARQAKALGMQTLEAGTPEHAQAEIKHARDAAMADAELEKLKTQLGIGTGTPSTEAAAS